MPPLNPFKKMRAARSNSESTPIAAENSNNSPPYSATPTRETFSSEPAQKENYSTITYQSVPIPKGYASPLGTFEQPQTPRTPAPQYANINLNDHANAAGKTPLSATGFTPMRREFPRTPTGLAPNDPKTPLSPTFQQEKILAKHDEKVEKLDRRDLVSLGPRPLEASVTDLSRRDGRFASVWARCSSGLSTSAARSSSSPSSLPPSSSSTPQGISHQETTCPRGLLVPQSGP